MIIIRLAQVLSFFSVCESASVPRSSGSGNAFSLASACGAGAAACWEIALDAKMPAIASQAAACLSGLTCSKRLI